MELSNMSLDQVKENLFLSIKSIHEMHETENLHENIVQKKKGNMAVVLSVATKKDDLMGTYSEFGYVTQEHLECWNLSEDEGFSIAYDNSKKYFPGILEPINKYITFSDEFLESDGEEIPSLYVLTNKQHFNGAITLFTEPEQLEALSNKSDIGKVAVVPISSDNVICVPLATEESIKDISEIYEEFQGYIKRNIGLTQGIMTYEQETKTFREASGEEFDLDIKNDASIVYGNTR